ncbi:MAG TPA: hypothetical protein VMO47_19010 [Rhodothermales bacterium]|nr:hypothetical protein [Rhodothermales bacterium]
MADSQFQKTRYGDEDVILRTILEGTAGETGAQFFDSLVRSVASAFGTHGAWVAEYLPQTRKLRAYSMLMGERMVHGFEYPIDGTPCREVIEETRLVCVPPDRVVENPELGTWNLEPSARAPSGGEVGTVLQERRRNTLRSIC